jgi:hypothetical protein
MPPGTPTRGAPDGGAGSWQHAAMSGEATTIGIGAVERERVAVV